mmetsp:Transcript_53227/g.173095  ORF Transcript_53227/g.173095 Transcript_53227/m.173095 type:complete len:158 (+) Transcript_53227:153-626(+)
MPLRRRCKLAERWHPTWDEFHRRLFKKAWVPSWSANRATIGRTSGSQSGEDQVMIVLSIEVQRMTSTLVFRNLIPCVLLVMISWGGFIISPKQLMPRFAASFVSSLSLQTLSGKVQTLMPAGAEYYVDGRLHEHGRHLHGVRRDGEHLRSVLLRVPF